MDILDEVHDRCHDTGRGGKPETRRDERISTKEAEIWFQKMWLELRMSLHQGSSTCSSSIGASKNQSFDGLVGCMQCARNGLKFCFQNPEEMWLRKCGTPDVPQ